MLWSLLTPLFLGFASVLQGGLNRRIGQNWGLGTAVLLNSLVLLVLASGLFIASKLAPERMPSIFQDRGSLSQFSWWYLIPGLCGFFLVAGLPLAIQKIGALKIFIGLIGAQLVASMLWDAAVEGVAISGVRIAGSLMAFAGALLVLLRG